MNEDAVSVAANDRIVQDYGGGARVHKELVSICERGSGIVVIGEDIISNEWLGLAAPDV